MGAADVGVMVDGSTCSSVGSGSGSGSGGGGACVGVCGADTIVTCTASIQFNCVDCSKELERTKRIEIII